MTIEAQATESPVIDINAALSGALPAEEGVATDGASETDDDLSDLLAEDLNLTPEQLQAAVKRIRVNAEKTQKLRADSHKLWGTSEKRAKKVEKREAALNQREQVFTAQTQQFNVAYAGLRAGSAKETLAGLAQLTGKDPIKVLEELNLHIANNGKRRELTPEEIELQQRIARLEQGRRDELEQAEHSKALAFVEQRKAQLAQVATDSADDFPALADFAKDNQQQVGEALAELIVTSARDGRKLTDAEAMRILDKHLDELSQRALKRKNGTTDSGSERGTGTPAKPEKPATAALKGKSLSASAATTPSMKRELTEEELSEDAANFLPVGLVNWARGSLA